MAERFYLSCALGPGPVELEGAEAHHLATVCRLRPGDAVCLFNGAGHEYPARVEQVGRRSVRLQVLGVETPGRELEFRLAVAAPLPKGDRAQFLVEKLTELGVTTFTPLKTVRSVVAAGTAKRDKLQRYAIEASKQCGRNVLMEVQPLAEWPAFCLQNPAAQRVLAHPGGAAELGERMPEETVLAVGPEGGFTEEEVEQAQAVGWRVVGLGPRILRIETAALVLAARYGSMPLR